MKLWGTVLILLGDVLLVHQLTGQKKKTVQCLWEITGVLTDVTSGVTQWKQTLKKAITEEKKRDKYAAMFREKFLQHNQTLPLREALEKALEELPLPKEAILLCSRYFSILGKVTDQTAEESFQHTKLQLEFILKQLQEELPKKQKLIRAGVYSMSALATVLLL